MLLASLALSLLPCLQDTAAPQSDPITGTWNALMTGDVEGLPPEGLDIILGLERLSATDVRASLDLQFLRLDDIAASYDQATGALGFAADMRGAQLTGDLVLTDDTLTGTLSGLSATVKLEGRRVDTTPPAPAEPAPPDPVPLEELTPADWRADLHYLSEQLPARHKNAFHTISQEDWTRHLAELDARLPDLDTRGSALAFAQLVALVGDAHTEFGWNSLPLWGQLPLRLRSFADGLFVIGADETHAEMLGARVVGIGTLPVGEAMQRAATTFAAENDSWRRFKLPQQLVIPELLVALGIAEDADAIPFTLEHVPGEHFEVVVGKGDGGALLRTPDPAFDPIPRWLTRVRENYWFEALPEARAVYCAYNRCSEDPARPMAGFIVDLLAEVEAAGAERLVLDLRHNAGGNSSILSLQLPALFAHENLQAPGAIVALIGPRTYSSGMMNAEQLRRAGGVLLGEPTGGRPNSYGEVRSFQLPRTGVKVYYSTKLFRMLDEDPPSVMPDEAVPLSSYDWLSGQDPVLARALER